jgi:hypothetical protein
MFIAHAPISYLANEAVQGKKVKRLKFGQEVLISAWALFCGLLPDFDFLALLAFRKPSFTHHDLITHTFVFWLGIYILMNIGYKLIYKRLNKKNGDFWNKDFFRIFSLTLLIGTFSHLLADLLVSGIMVLYPFSTNDFSVLQTLFPPSYQTGYYLSFYLAIELVFVSLFLVVFTRKFLKKQKWDDPIAYSLMGLSVIYLLFTIGMYTQTYNKGLHFDANNDVTEDLDFDGIKDPYDYDVNDNDINNIDEAVSSHIASSGEVIIASNKIAVPQKKDLDTLEKILYEYGAMNSYRIISQAYFENRLPIEPVLEKEVKNRMESPIYCIDFEPVEELYTYLKNNNSLLNLNISSPQLLAQGKIFFILDEEMNILNLGLTLTENNVGIVLPNDVRLTEHSFTEILENYDKESILIEIQE